MPIQHQTTTAYAAPSPARRHAPPAQGFCLFAVTRSTWWISANGCGVLRLRNREDGTETNRLICGHEELVLDRQACTGEGEAKNKALAETIKRMKSVIRLKREEATIANIRNGCAGRPDGSAPDRVRL